MTDPNLRGSLRMQLTELEIREYQEWQRYQIIFKEVELLRLRWVATYSAMAALKAELNIP